MHTCCVDVHVIERNPTCSLEVATLQLHILGGTSHKNDVTLSSWMVSLNDSI